MFALGKADRPLCVTNNLCIPDKSTMGWCAVVFVRVVLCLTSLMLTKTPVARTPCLTGVHVCDRIVYVFLPTVVESVTGLYPRWAGQLHSLETATSCLNVINKKPMGLGMWNFIQWWAVNMTINYSRNFTLQMQTCQYAKLYQYWCISHIFVAAICSIHGRNCGLPNCINL